MALALLSRKLRTDFAIGIVMALIAVSLVRLRPAPGEVSTNDITGIPARFFDRREFGVYDQLVRTLAAPSRNAPKLVLIDFDEQSLVGHRQSLGTWPWPRSALARMTDELRALGARMVVFDQSFSEVDGRSRGEDAVFAQSLAKLDALALGFEWSRYTDPAQSAEGPWAFRWRTFDDRAAAFTAVAPFVAQGARPYLLTENGAVGVWLGGYRDGVTTLAEIQRLGIAPGTRPTIRPLVADERLEPITPDLLFAENAALPVVGEHGGMFQSTSRMLLPPVLPLLGSAADCGSSEYLPDHDGVVRGVNHLVKHEGRYYPSLALRIVTRLAGSRQVEVQPGTLRVGAAGATFDEQGRTLIRYRQNDARSGGYPVLSADAVLRSAERRGLEREPEARLVELVRDAVVILGEPAAMRSGVVSSSLGRTTLHSALVAASTEDLMARRSIRRASVDFDSLIALGFALLGSIVSTLVMRTASLRRSLFLELIVAASLFAGVGWAGTWFFRHGLWVGSVIPFSAFVAVLVVGTLIAYGDERNSADWIREALGSSTSSGLIHRVMRSPEMYGVDGATRVVGLYLSELSEASTVTLSDPAHYVERLRLLATQLAEETARTDGLLDASGGGRPTAFWGAPVSRALVPAQVARTALAVRDALARHAPEGESPRWSLAAIELGEMVVGEMGAQGRHGRSAYSVTGPVRSMAYRLLAIGQILGSDILTGPAFHQATADDFEYRDLGLFQFSPTLPPVELFELLGTPATLSPDQREFRDAYEKARRLSREGGAAEALEQWVALSEMRPEDRATRVHRRLLESRVGLRAPWDGVVPAHFLVRPE